MELLRSVTVGSYVPADTLPHRLDPRAKVMLVALGMTAVFSASATVSLLALLLACVAAAVVARLPLGYFLGGLRSIGVLLVFTLVFNLLFVPGGRPLLSIGAFAIKSRGLHMAAIMTLRLTLLYLMTSLFTLTTSPLRITDAIESLLSPLRKVGLPSSELAMMTSIALRFIPTLVETTEKILKAQVARGARFNEGNAFSRARALVPVLVPLFVQAFRAAEDLAVAMEARCYRGGANRTRMVSLRFTASDLMVLLVVGALLASICWLDARWPW